MHIYGPLKVLFWSIFVKNSTYTQCMARIHNNSKNNNETKHSVKYVST